MLGTELATLDRPVATVGGERRRARGTAPWQTATRRKGKAHSPGGRRGAECGWLGGTARGEREEIPARAHGPCWA